MTIEQKSVSDSPFIDRLRIDDDGLREPFAGLKGMHDLAEVGQRFRSSDCLRHDHHLAAADETIRPSVIVVQEERVESGMIAAELPQRLLLDLVLHAAAAQSPDLTARRIDDHQGARLLRRRPSGFHDLAQNQFPIHFQ